MQASRFWMLGALAFTAPLADAQVELVYHVDGSEHVIVGTHRGRLIYMQNGKMVPPAGKGEWEIRPSATFAEELGALEVSYYIQPLIGKSAAERAGQVTLCYKLAYNSEASAKKLYCIFAWEVEGKLTAVAVRPFFETEPGKFPWVYGQMPIKDADRNGHLRAYLFREGKSLRGVAKRDLDLTEFRAALDRNDVAAASAWLQGRALTGRCPRSWSSRSPESAALIC